MEIENGKTCGNTQNKLFGRKAKERRRQVMRMEHMYASRNCQNSAFAAPLGLADLRLRGCRVCLAFREINAGDFGRALFDFNKLVALINYSHSLEWGGDNSWRLRRLCLTFKLPVVFTLLWVIYSGN